MVLFWMAMMAAHRAEAALRPLQQVLSETQAVRVRMIEGKDALSIRGLDLRLTSGGVPLASPRNVSHWSVRCLDGGVTARSSEGAVVRSRGPIRFESPGGFLSLNQKTFRDSIWIHPKTAGTCVTVNHVSLEKYLDGLVNKEFNAQWSSEAIDAQVIAARTYAVYMMRQARMRPQQPYDLDSTIRDQVYEGSDSEDPRASRSAQRTRGWLLAAKELPGVPLKAYYHSTCGGRTGTPQEVWGKRDPGFQHGVHCGFCNTSPRFYWDVPLSSGDLRRAILQGISVQGVPAGWPADWKSLVENGALTGISAQSHIGDRMDSVALIWRMGPTSVRLTLPATSLRAWIGPTKVLSTSFQVYAAGADRWVVRGRGYGHGVGLCQWGAKVMGDRGFKAAQILRHYYPGATLYRAW